MVKRELRDAERVYVNGILQNGLESGNNKPFWKYVKSQKQETFGIFTPQSGNTFPQLPSTQFPQIKPLHISENGVFMLLDRIDVSKSSGTDKLPGRLLQSLAKEITPVVHFIFTLLNHFVLANYLLNGHKLMLHLFLRKAVSYRQ